MYSRYKRPDNEYRIGAGFGLLSEEYRFFSWNALRVVGSCVRRTAVCRLRRFVCFPTLIWGCNDHHNEKRFYFVDFESRRREREREREMGGKSDGFEEPRNRRIPRDEGMMSGFFFFRRRRFDHSVRGFHTITYTLTLTLTDTPRNQNRLLS